MTSPTGRLYVVSTPIGNLEDLTFRAVRVLKEADRILAEDTRVSRVLLAAHGIEARLSRFDEHVEVERVEQVVEELAGGAVLALITDAGTPALSDPGQRLIRAAREKGLPVEVIPGASAITTALVASGLPAASFAFFGFPPRAKGEKTRFLGKVLAFEGSAIFFESPYRIVDTLGLLADQAPAREAAVCRELTKKFEEVLRGPLADLRAQLAARAEVKGEITVVIAPPEEPAPTARPVDVGAEIQRLREEGRRDKEIAQAIAKATGRKVREVYAELVKSKPE